MKMKFFSATSKTKRHINANDKSAMMTIATAIVLLGAFFVINAGGLTAFADIVDPNLEKVNFTTNGAGPVHPGELLVLNKAVNLTQSITDDVNVTVTQFFEGTTELCVDLRGQPVLNVTTRNDTTFLSDGFLLYNETLIAMPGVYHCNVIFRAVNVTDSSDSQVIGNQTIWIDAIGSQGFWKNHPNATEQHLNITLGDFNGGFEVGDNETATELFKAHKGKFDLDKLAAQLLAAKLNIWALNMTEPFDKVDCIKGNVTAADDLLGERDYEGVDTGETKFGKDKRDALKLHKFLDIFNNFGCDGDPPLQGDP